MADVNAVNDRLFADLVADLKPVKRLRSPWLRGLGWLAVVVAIAAVLLAFADFPAIRHRLMAVPDMWLAVLGSALTAILGAFAAFQLGLPDRSPWWSVLPLPGLLLWLGASGFGCARSWFIPGVHEALLVETGRCLRFIIGLSVPLSIAMFLMLRRGYSLYPTLMGGTAGLAVAAAAATLLVLFHPFDVTVTDLSVHLVAVAIVILANRYLGKAAFPPKRRASDALG